MRALGVLLVSAAVALTAGCGGFWGPEQKAQGGQAGRAGATTRPAAPVYDFPPAPRITVPSRFRAEVYATGLTRPTAMAYGPDGRLYVAEETGAVVTVPPRSRRPRVFVSGFPTPLGLAWKSRRLYVSAQGRLESVRLAGREAVGRRTVLAGLPYRLHQQNNVVVGRGGRLYLGSGSTCNACVEGDPRSATILSVLPSGRDLRVVATGLRNAFGLAVEPRTGRLYASVNGRDDLGDAEPAEAIVLVRPGRDFGWPACWPSAELRRLAGSCRGVAPPVAYLEPHSSADGLTFWRGDLYVALWGQYYSSEHGRRVDRVDLPSGRVSPFAAGFDHPLAVAVDPHGALLVADWGRGVIYRIQAKNAP
jgi:glucose/arabinose dehydrogenase